MSESEIIQQRVAKVSRLRETGIEPYAYDYARTHRAEQVLAENGTLAEGQTSAAPVSVAGRLATIRSHGKTIFAHLQDESGRVQLYFRQNDLPPEKFALAQDLDMGDFIGVRGPVFKTRTGEVTVKVEEIVLLTKSIRPMPEKWHGLKDVEIRYRQRYLDLISNESTRAIFKLRSHIVREIRDWFDGQGYIEVETPMMQSIPGGAAAKPFQTHHNALNRDLFLRIAPELYLKRLLVGGFEKVYEINRNFRNEGIDTLHNPEFTMLEAYQAYANGAVMMELTENLFAHLAQTLKGTTTIPYQGQQINLAAPWRRLTYRQAVNDAVGGDVWEANEETLRKLCHEQQIPAPPKATRAELLALLFETLVEPTLIQPTFVTDFPLELSPLAKSKPGHPELADRFEPYIVGHEFANGFSELNDPQEQQKRFEAQMAKRQLGDEEAQRLDADYIRALEYGMPPAGGLGIGIDRLIMLMTDSASIREVILFPQLRSIEIPAEDDSAEDAPAEPAGGPEAGK